MEAVLFSADEALTTDVLRLAAAAGIAPAVVKDLGSLMRVWSTAPAVLVGTDVAAGLAALSPQRRARTHLVGHGPLPDRVFRAAVAIGAESVAELPVSDAWLVEMLTDVADGAARPGEVVGVIGGSGGAGASIFAAALASAATSAGSVLLVDADPLGAGLDQILGMEGAEGIRWDALMHSTGRLSARSLRETLPEHEGVAVLTWPAQRSGPLEAFAMREVLSAGARGFDHVLLDLPRHPDPVTDEAITRCDRLILVSTLTLPAVSAAGRLAMRLPEAVPRHLVTRGRHSGITPEEVSRLLGTPLLVAMGDQRGLDESVNLGAGPTRGRRGPLARAAREAMDALAARLVAA